MPASWISKGPQDVTSGSGGGDAAAAASVLPILEPHRHFGMSSVFMVNGLESV